MDAPLNTPEKRLFGRLWLRLLAPALLCLGAASASATTVYSIGNPSNEEQYYLELINRARADPANEGVLLEALDDCWAVSEYNFWSVDLIMMKNEFAALGAVPPLSFNQHLNLAARAHSADMLSSGFQGHTSSSGATWPGANSGTRATNTGYTGWTAMSENVYSNGENPEHAHASFEVDWGAGSGGMQTNRAHRGNIHSATYREIGVGVVHGSNGNYGPDFVTEDFGIRPSVSVFVTGVVYYDSDDDAFYDREEGLGGVRVEVSGASYHAITSDSGGYSVPVPGDGNYTVSFLINGEVRETQQIVVSSSESVKVDWRPPLVPMFLSGPPSAPIDTVVDFYFDHLDGSESYEVKVATVDAAPGDEGAENGSAELSFDNTPIYPVIQTAVKRSGTSAFHLAHDTANSPSQSFTLERFFVPESGGQLHFYSRLRFADEAQVAKVQVSEDEGLTWTRIWYQRGSWPYPDEGSFSLKTVSLSAWAGKHIQFRFVLASTSGFYAEGVGAQYGWYVDDISFSGVDELLDESIPTLAPDTKVFSYAPDTVGPQRLFIRAQTDGGVVPWSDGHDLIVGENTYEGWADRWEIVGGLPPGTLSDPAGDYDQDGYPEALEYALEPDGSSPITGESGDPPTINEATGFIVYDFQIDSGRDDLDLFVTVSTDLVNWYQEGEPGAPTGFEVNFLSGGAGTVELYRAQVPDTEGPLFFRLEATVFEF